MREFKRIILSLISLVIISCNEPLSSESFIRMNQVGFKPDDFKTAVLISDSPIKALKFVIKNRENKTVYENQLIADTSFNNHFRFSARINFSDFKTPGEYYIQVNNIRTRIFKIRENVFNSVRDSLILFFKVQRCGPTKPFLHEPCHLQDATEVIGYKNSQPIDMTGGWHDAGDYTKFLFTTAYTTYLLLFSYEFEPKKFEFDLDKNSVPDILEEARIGLDFLLRCNFADDAFITQVQDDRDHTVGWRLPENDTLTFNRPAFVKMNKSQVGIYAATMALANRIWKTRFYDNEFAEICINAGIKLFDMRDKINNFKDQEKYYTDSNYIGKLALGAIELYNTTKNPKYLKLANEYGKQTQPDFWWSWGDFNSLTFYRLSFIDSSYKDLLRKNLDLFEKNSNQNFFNEPTVYSWGTTTTFLGAAINSILYKKLTNDPKFDKLAIDCRDFVLGKNPWGMSFIYGIGHSFPQKIHSQIAYFKKGYLPGALIGGPAPKNLFDGRNIKKNLSLRKFDYNDVIYFDDFNNYINNEPTISGNATALFIYGYFSSSDK